MSRWSLIVALFLASSSPAAALGENERDIFDRPVTELVSQGLPTMVLYANKTTKDAIQGPAAEMAVRLASAPFATVVHVDLRDIPALFRGIARGKIKNSYRDAIDRFGRAFRDAGHEPPSDAASRLIFVADNDGKPHQAVGLGRGFGEALAVIYDSSGHELCRGFFPRERDRIEQALRDASYRKRTAAH